MSVQRYQIIYPNCLFRAKIFSKNVAPPEDDWAEGALCSCGGEIFIINRRKGEGSYGLDSIHMDTLGLASGFRDGNKTDIFEGDIIRITRYVPVQMNEEYPQDAEQEENCDPSAFHESFDDDEEEEFKEREVSPDVPEGAEVIMTVDGIVFMCNSVFYIQYFDEQMQMLASMPLGMFFGYDMLPAYDAAVKVVGNIYDNEDEYAKICRLS